MSKQEIKDALSKTEKQKLHFVWKLKKNNFQWTDKKNGKGIMTFANEELLWYIGTEEEINKYFPETKDHKFDFCHKDVIIIMLKNPNLENRVWLNEGKQFIQNSFDEAIKLDINLSDFNEWWMYKKGITDDLVCPECNRRMKGDKYGDYPSRCEGKLFKNQGYKVDCDAKLYRTWEDNGTFKDIFYAVDLKELALEEEYQRKQQEKEEIEEIERMEKLSKNIELTDKQLEEQSRINYKAMDGDVLTKEEFEAADEMTKFLFLEQYKANQLMKVKMMSSDIELKNKREISDKKLGRKETAHSPVTDTKTQISDDDEMYEVCKKYIHAIVDMYNLSTVQGAEERRSKWHEKLVDLTGLDRGEIGSASSMLDSTIGFPSAQLQGGTSVEQRKIIVIDYGHKLYRWILREKRRLKK